MIKCPKCGHNKFAIDVTETRALTYRDCTIEDNYFEPEWVKDWGSGDFFEASSTAKCESCGHEFNHEEIEEHEIPSS